MRAVRVKFNRGCLTLLSKHHHKPLSWGPTQWQAWNLSPCHKSRYQDSPMWSLTSVFIWFIWWMAAFYNNSDVSVTYTCDGNAFKSRPPTVVLVPASGQSPEPRSWCHLVAGIEADDSTAPESLKCRCSKFHMKQMMQFYCRWYVSKASRRRGWDSGLHCRWDSLWISSLTSQTADSVLFLEHQRL